MDFADICITSCISLTGDPIPDTAGAIVFQDTGAEDLGSAGDARALALRQGLA